MESVEGPVTGPAADQLVGDAISLVARWLDEARSDMPSRERTRGERLEALIEDPDGVAFAMRFVDRIIRPEDEKVAAHQLETLVRRRGVPSFLGRIDRLLLRAGATLAPRLPSIVLPLAVKRMRQLVGHLVVDADPEAMAAHLSQRQDEGFALNVNLLGEAVLGQAEADRRLEASIALLDRPQVTYVSVKVSAIVPQLNPWDHEGSIERVVERLRRLFEAAQATSPPTFVNLDMEEYHDLDLTMSAFTRLLDEPAFHTMEAGIVLQAYLPDSFPALQQLVGWANARRRREVDGEPGAQIKIRLVKGANLAMERVDAAMHGWAQTPYETKTETDANYKRCLDWVLTRERTEGVRVGVASHNLFDVAWAHLLSSRREVSRRVELEMLQGMAPSLARTVRSQRGGLLLYTPIVRADDFDVAISYLFRRLEENAADENFIRHLFSLTPGSPAFETEARRFAAAVEAMDGVAASPRRTQDRTTQHSTGWRQRAASRSVSSRFGPSPAVATDGALGAPPASGFVNEPDTDPALAPNRAWIAQVLARPVEPPTTALLTDTAKVDDHLARATAAQRRWGRRSPRERLEVLDAIADELSRRRGDLVAAMVDEGSKTVAEADPEVSEAIDFARWYGRSALDLERNTGASFAPLGVVAVVPPWNFPVAIAAGGTFAALAAGNAVVLKPAPATPRCAEIVAECCWSAGVGEALQFVRTPDDDVGRHLICHPSVRAVVLTGAYETASLFRSWRPDLRIIAETSGKNAMIITPNADLDLAVADLVASAFGHGGQKCSAASLAICVGDVYRSERFRRQLVDAVASLEVGPATELATSVGPLIGPPEAKLERGLTTLEAGESWLVEPEQRGEALWRPGVRLGVTGGSWFHQTECFGPVLGLMEAVDLDEAIRFQNTTPFGLTGGLHSLDPEEIEQWADRVEVGNAYINRTTTGAIVGRQPFGGWKRSVIGPGAKAGGPNYVAQLGLWSPTDDDLSDEAWLLVAAERDRQFWADELSVEHDATGLYCEANRFRYRPLPGVAVRVENATRPGVERDLARVVAGAKQCGVRLVVSRVDDETAEGFAARVPELVAAGLERIRVLGGVAEPLRGAANEHGVHLADGPVTTDPRVELLTFVREQVVTQTLHRYGNLV